MLDNKDGEANDTILYELLIYAEWPQDPEVQVKGTSDKVDDRSAAVGNPWKWLGPFAPTICPPLAIQKLTSQAMSWQFAVGGEGRVIAVLQDQYLEIRSSRDEYGSVLGRINVTKDPSPHWRKIVWSPDCSLLAFAHSNGSIDLYDLIGAHLFTINSKETNQDLAAAVAGMVFCDLRTKNTQWSYELIVANYRGDIKAYFVSPTDSYQDSHEFSVANYYPSGISAFVYHNSSQLLLLSGKSNKFSASDTSSNALRMGITAWRILLGRPYYKLALSLEDELSLQKIYWWQTFPVYWKSGMSSDQDVVFKMSISPNQDTLAAIHTSGALSLWDLPSLRLRKFWDLTLQPNYSDMNPQYCEPGMKRKAAAVVSNAFRYHLVDVNWWSQDTIILARCCGAVTVSSVHSLKNLLGISPEWFESSVQISASYDRGFLAMECECYTSTKKKSSGETFDIDSDESSDDDEVSFFTRATEIAKTAMFYVTDNERFRPPRKKMRFLNKTYRLLCLKSTTPEELFARKLNNEEYGEALVLAKTYNMDCDLVYQRQWRKTPASVATIQDYLSKITKRAWVLHECLERVPETIDAAKELLMYGLRGTDLQALISVGRSEDHGRFVAYHSFDGDVIDDEYEDYTFNVEKAKERKIRKDKKQAALLKQINFSRLSLEQKQLCECRLKLLVYLDRLSTYEAILGGPGMASPFYDHNFFRKFRSQSGLEACISFAHDSNWQAIAAMFTYHGNETLQHHLPILSNFPETTSPIVYQLLLPKLGYSKDGPVVCPWNEDEWRIADWCESKYRKSVTSPVSDDFVVDFYEENKQFLKYKGNFTPEIISKWYLERAREIESHSYLVENAVDLVILGTERNVQGLETLFDNLKTLETLIYDCPIMKDISLKELEEMDDFEVVQLLMSKSTEENFIKHVKQWLLPFLSRCEKHKAGSSKALLKRYLIDVSKEDLNFCRKVIENAKRDHHDAIIPDVEDQLSLALDCIYVCEKTGNLKDVCVILENLPHRSTNASTNASKLFAQIADLEKCLRIAELIEKNGSSVTLGLIKNCSEDSEEIEKLLTKLTRLAGRRHPPLREANWTSLLTDVLEIQKLFNQRISVELCYEIFLHSLLCSGRKETIDYAGKMMVCSQKKKKDQSSTDHSHIFKLPYENSVALVLKAAQEYFNSSATLTDPCMNLAWACLNVIEDTSPAIQEELDLISSLKLLQEFSIKILPLQVRLCTDRLKLVQQAMNNKPKAYRTPQRLLNLAYLLRVCGDNKKEREGKVLSLVAEAAFQEKDYEPCWNACSQLMEGGHEEGWNICYDLGRCKGFQNIKARCDLMSFALVHCSSDLLQDILKSKLELQLQVTCERVKFLIGEDSPVALESIEFLSDDTNGDVAMASESDGNPLWQTGEKTLQVLQSTTKTTKAVLTSVRNTRFWKDAVKWIKPHELPWEDNSSGEATKNKDLMKQGICAFYSGLIEDAHISEFDANYQRYATPDLSQSLEISSKLLRVSLLEDTIKAELPMSGLNAAVVVDLAKAYLPEDTIYSLSLLLGLKQFDEVEDLFSKLPSTPVVLQFASLFYALQIHACLEDYNLPVYNGQYLTAPAIIIRVVEDYMESEEAAKHKSNAFVQEAYKHLKKYNKKLDDFIQAELLHSIGGGVDAARFTSDDIYKKETILGIAMTLDDKIFQTAVSLAHHYRLDLWDVYMAHLEYLFSESRLSNSAMETRVENLKLLDVLMKQPKTFSEKLMQSVYPNIDGKDHGRLLWYFSLLETCGDEPDEVGLKPSVHRKLLSKFRQYKCLDYKLLMKPNKSPVEYLSSLLNEANVHVFAKAATKIPDINGHFLNSSTVYSIWVTKYFFEGSGPNKKVPQSTSEWLHRYESCNDMLQRLAPPDFLTFVHNVVFSEKSLDVLAIECRSEIIKRCIKFSRQRDTKSKDAVEQTFEWKSVLRQLQQYSKHLSRMEDPILMELKSNDDPRAVSYLREFDLSCSIPDKLKKLLTNVVIKGPDLSLLKTLLSCCPSDLQWEPSDAYLEAIHLVVNQLRGTENAVLPPLQPEAPILALEKILNDISDNRDDLMIDDMAMAFDVIYEFCQDSSVSVTVRLKVLQLLEKTNYISEEYSSLLMLYQTQAVVISIWPDYEVTEDDIKGEQERKILFDKLMASCTTLNHFCSLAELLVHWPPFAPSLEDTVENKAWVQVLCGLANLPEKESIEKVVSFFEKAHSKQTLSKQSCWKIFQEISKTKSILHILKLAFKTKYENLHIAAINMLKECPALTSKEIDDELLKLVLEQHLTVHVVSTSLYKYVIEYLLDQQENFSVDSVIGELTDAGCHPEAGSLTLIASRTHTSLSTFSSALQILNRWIPKQKI